MCGIAGLVQWRRPVDDRQLKRGVTALHHRGPDGVGFWFSPDQEVGLGHARLGIIAPHNASQPVANEDESIVAIVNGEFYGFEALRVSLRAKGYVFRTDGDSEILVHLYKEYGVDCLAYLRGEFSFALWDDKAKKLFCARDRFGIKPFCYAETKDGLSFASEAKALLAMGHEAQWNKDAFFTAASLQYTLPHQSLFAGVSQLPPGHYLILERGGLRLHRYWDMDWPQEPEVNDLSETDAIASFRHIMAESVRLRLRADVRVCCHLSGGLDSSSLLGQMAAETSKPVDCFTVRFDQAAYDESAIAEETAQSLGAVYHSIHVTQSAILETLPRAVFHGEGLAINGHISAKYLLNQAIQKAGFRVALSGEGADEILSGYPHLREDLARHQGAHTSSLERLYNANTVLQGVHLPSGEGLFTGKVQGALGFVPTFLAAKATLGFKISQLLSEDFRQSFKDRDAFGDMIESMDVSGQLKQRHPVYQSSYLWSKLALTSYILRTLGDGMEMAHGVEGRVPFLDHHFVEQMRELPLSMKIRNGVEKYILREAAKPMLTQTVYKRQKHSFMAPPLGLLRDPKLRDVVRQILTSADFGQKTFFAPKKMARFMERLDQMNETQMTAIEPVIMMALSSYHLADAFNLAV